MAEKKKRLSGTKQLKEAEKVPVMIGIPETDCAIIDAAAASESRTRVNFIMHHGVRAAIEAAKNILEKSSKNA